MHCKSVYDMQIDEYIKLYSSIFFDQYADLFKHKL